VSGIVGDEQKRITIDGDHFYIDLVFYNRLLRCFVLIDLKIGKLNHQDIRQISFTQISIRANFWKKGKPDHRHPALRR